MKVLVSSWFALACVWFSVPANAQVQPQEHWICVDSKCRPAANPLPEGAPNIVTLTANTIAGDVVVKLKGSVEIHTGSLTLQADEADYQWATGEIEARGNVHVIPVFQPSENGRRQRTDVRAIGNTASAAAGTPAGAVQGVQTANASFSALSVTTEGDSFHLKGAAQIRTETFSLKADEVTYQSPNGEMRIQGDVQIKPAPAVGHGLGQFGIK